MTEFCRVWKEKGVTPSRNSGSGGNSWEFLLIPSRTEFRNSVAEFSRVWKGIASQHKTRCEGEGEGVIPSGNSGIGMN